MRLWYQAGLPCWPAADAINTHSSPDGVASSGISRVFPLLAPVQRSRTALGAKSDPIPVLSLPLDHRINRVSRGVITFITSQPPDRVLR